MVVLNVSPTAIESLDIGLDAMSFIVDSMVQQCQFANAVFLQFKRSPVEHRVR